MLEDFYHLDIWGIHPRPHNTQPLSSQIHSEKMLISKLLKTKQNKKLSTLQIATGQQVSLTRQEMNKSWRTTQLLDERRGSP